MTEMTRMTGIFINCVLNEIEGERVKGRKERINNCGKSCHSCHLVHLEKGDLKCITTGTEKRKRRNGSRDSG